MTKKISKNVALEEFFKRNPVIKSKFKQEYVEKYTTKDNPLLKDVKRLQILDGSLFAASSCNEVINYDYNLDKWEKFPKKIQEIKQNAVHGLVDIVEIKGKCIIGAEEGLFVLEDAGQRVILNSPVKQIAGNGKDIYVASEDGLFTVDANLKCRKIEIRDEVDRIWADKDIRGVAIDSFGKLWIATKAGVIVGNEEEWKFYTGKDGVPYSDFTRITAASDGTVWFGTHFGAVLYHKEIGWGYRQGLGWLTDDDIHDVIVDDVGNVWFATEEGVTKIYYKEMDLSDKASVFEKDIQKISRTPYGFFSEGYLSSPGDLSKIKLKDSDNDGSWLSNYGAGECFAYAVTGKQEFKNRAVKAFKGLKFLQDVPQTSLAEHRPPKGYFARTIRSTGDPDPNDGRFEADIEMQKNNDRDWKIYEPRWPKSGDGKWYWKSDVSSDEFDAHFFFYGIYYSLVCETEEEKEELRQVVVPIIEHLITNDFKVIDFDGKPTRYGIYDPEVLNQNKDWFFDRGLKSLSILSYLAVAEHVTENARYSEVSKMLIEKHGYKANCINYKTQYGFGTGTPWDTELASYCFYSIMHFSKDDDLKETVAYSAYSCWRLISDEMNPLFNFIYASFGFESSFTDAYKTLHLEPWDDWLEDSVYTLKNMPMDHVLWNKNNSHREDIINLPRNQVRDIGDDKNLETRGYRVNRKVVPIENRSFPFWDSDLWQLDTGMNGMAINSGITYLLPYYMGVYFGFIE